MIEYPDWLPWPQRQGYGFQMTDPTVRTRMESGFERQRRKFLSVPSRIPVAWILSDAQAQLFMAWWEEVLVSGTLKFECPLQTPLGHQAYPAVFVGAYSGPHIDGANHWRITAELRLDRQPVLRGGWAQHAPDYILGSDLLDIAMNEKWPRA